MGKSYQEHFEQRGSAYDRAMLQFPAARQQEFEQVIAAAQISPNMTVADVPAGGGYLRPFLPAGVVYLAHEPCASFTNHGAVPGTVAREGAAPAGSGATQQGGLPLLKKPTRFRRGCPFCRCRGAMVK